MPDKLYSRDILALQILRDLEEEDTGQTTALADPHSVQSNTKIAQVLLLVYDDVKDTPHEVGTSERDEVLGDAFVSRLQADEMLTGIVWDAAMKTRFHTWLAEVINRNRQILFQAQLDVFNETP